MFLGKALGVFAATLVFSASISVAGEGTGLNSTDASGHAHEIPPLPILFSQFDRTLPDGNVETILEETVTASSLEERVAIEAFAQERLQESVQKSKASNLISLRAEDDVPSNIVDEDFIPAEARGKVRREAVTLPKSFVLSAKKKLAEGLNQIRIDPGYSLKVREFVSAYWSDFKAFPKTQMTKGNLTISIVRGFANSALMYTSAVYYSGVDNIAPHQAFMSILINGTMSAGFSYFSKLLPWNRPFPLPADTKFWRSMEFGTQFGTWVAGEVVFLTVARGSMEVQNLISEAHGEAQPYHLGPYSDVIKTTFDGTGAQAPYEMASSHQYLKAKTHAKKWLKESPEQEEEVKHYLTQAHNWMNLKNMVISIMTNTLAMQQMKGWSYSHLGFEALRVGGAIAVTVAWDLPGKIYRGFFQVKNFILDCQTRLSAVRVPQE